MSEKNVFKQISEKIKNLNHKQTAFFAWLCSIRVLPFIGVTGNINFWKKNNKANQHLYAIINAIDVVAIYGDNYYNASSARNAIRAARAASDAAQNAAYATSAYGAAHNAALSAHDAAHTIVHAIEATRSIAYDAARGIRNVARGVCDVADAANKYKIELHNIILDDISYIEKHIYDEFNNDTNLYSNVWGNFQEALNDVGCSYWGRLYENIFQSRFQIDKKALKIRLSVPQEIKDLGAKAVAEYLEQIESIGSENLNETRIIILGEKGAGKTCLARRLIKSDAPMTKPNESTVGVDSTIWKIEDKETSSTVNVHIWDFAGHVITHAAHRCFLSERCLYILVYNGRTERYNQIEYWLDHVKNYGGDAPVLVLINKFDNNKPDIPENTLKKKYPFIKDFFYFSIDEDKDDLEYFRVKTSELIRNNPMWNNQKMPSSYYKVKNALRKLFDDKIDYIDKTQFYAKADENDVTNREKQDNLLESLHLLGICLWYKDIKDFDMLVLNPDWITNGIYKVINWMHNNSKPTISFDDFEKVFNDEKDRYPKDRLKFILKLMERYELAFSKDDGKITIPHILREDQPNKLPNFLIEESLMIKYTSEQPLPPNTICRLIVRHHEEIRDYDEIWRYGVVLEYNTHTIALIEEDNRNITIKVKGDNKSEYISKLRKTMNEIFESYKSDKPDLQYRIIRKGQIEIQSYDVEDILLPYGIIKSHINKKRPYLTESEIDISYESFFETAQIYQIGGIQVGDNYYILDNKGQVNLSKDKSVINAKQNNCIDSNKLNELIENLKNAFPENASKSDKEVLNDFIEIVDEESKKAEPKKSTFRTALNSLKIIKGSAEFAAAVATIAELLIG